MSVKLNEAAFEQAKELIQARKVVLDDRDAWSEHQPRAADENRFIESHGLAAYGRWHLGVDDEAGASKGRYKFPYGDFENVHRCAVLAAESRAGQYKHFDIERACAHLHGAMDLLRDLGPKRSDRNSR
ncbi:MAG: hypothetical protein JWO83_1833 [Caulobacteraceae bacterium]|jgi:hypothetical protein|nr:hypothetical protein [Caulobacteraceae bacterium]